jgi:hypothetical protein
MRPTESSSFNLWGNAINPHAVRQGILGDCWFLGTLSALGEWPERAQMLISDNSTDAGIFEMNFYKQGQAQRVTIDDRLPKLGSQYGNQLAFTK